MASPGRQKSECEFCLFGGGFCARRAAPCAGLAVFARPAAVMRAFAPGVLALFLQAQHTRGGFFSTVCPACLLCSRPARRFSAAFTQTFAPVCLACAAAARRALCVRSSVLFRLSVCLFCVVCTGFLSCFFALSCLTFSSQTSFHLSLRPRRALPRLSPPAALFPTCAPLISFCPTRAAGTCPPCALCAQFRLVLAVCLPVLRCLCARFFLLSFAFSCLAFCLSNFFSFVAHAATGTPFSFRKENGGKEPRGERRAAPLRTPFQRPAANLPFSLAAGRLTRPSGRNSPADGETLEKLRSKAQLFKRFCAKEDACALRPISPFPALLAGLSGPLGRKSPAGGETLEKPKEQSSAFRAFLCVGDAPELPPCPGKQEPCAGAHPESAACVRGWAQMQTRSATCPPQVCSPQARASSRLQGTEIKFPPCPRKQEACVGAHSESAAGVRG